MKVLVAGGGGFIGAWLTRQLLEEGHEVRAVDLKPADQWWQHFDDVDNMLMDLCGPMACGDAVEGMERVYNLACDMGGIGFIESHKAECMRSVLINTNLIEAARLEGVERYLFTSSACVYGEGQYTREDRAYPARPEDGYGWEKLFSERMCRHYTEDYGFPTRVARLHNVYGPHGSWQGGREKAPAAICRKVAEAVRDGKEEIELWGDGEQTRSFMHVDDCLEGLQRIMDGECSEPVNLGSSELVTVNQLAAEVCDVAGVQMRFRHDESAPQGVRGRNSDNTLMRERYGWEPSRTLSEGLEDLYPWVAEQAWHGQEWLGEVGSGQAGQVQ